MTSLALFTLLLIAPLGSALAVAQASEPDAVSGQASEQAKAENPEAGNSVNSAGNEPEKQATTPEDAQPSPFDYNPSEEISEDLSVSFPVDI